MKSGARDRILDYMYRSATRPVPMDHTKLALEEMFLWGCQTAQALNGVGRSSPKFIVKAGVLLGRRGKRVEGWQLNLKDGTSHNLVFGENLKTVVKARRKSAVKKTRRKRETIEGAEPLSPLFS